MFMTRPAAVILIGIVMFVGACSPRGASTEQSAPTPARAAPATPAAQVSPAKVFEFTFGFRNGTQAEDPRIVRTEDSPCGDLPVARVGAIPMNDKVLVADPVVEFDAAGKEIAHWGKPNGAEVIALDGGRLQFLANGKVYWTDPAGRIHETGAAPALANSEFLRGDSMFPCPALPTFPSAEGSQQCFRVRDAAGKQRQIALEGICS